MAMLLSLAVKYKSILCAHRRKKPLAQLLSYRLCLSGPFLDTKLISSPALFDRKLKCSNLWHYSSILAANSSLPWPVVSKVVSSYKLGDRELEGARGDIIKTNISSSYNKSINCRIK
jgi:hypothetical protein